MFSKKNVIATVVLLLVGCSPTLYVPTEKDASESVSLESLQQGRALYVRKCGSCHMLHLPQEFNQTAWSNQLDEMQDRAGIQDSDRDLILTYLARAAHE